jgi:hypothetical protein
MILVCIAAMQQTLLAQLQELPILLFSVSCGRGMYMYYGCSCTIAYNGNYLVGVGEKLYLKYCGAII